MTLTDVHEAHGATFEEHGGRQVVAEYGRPDRAHRAVRNVVGVIEQPYDVLVVTGDDRLEYVDNAVSNGVPQEDGRGVYALLLTPQGRIRTDMYIYNAGERLLVFLPPGQGDSLADEWNEMTFIQDVEIAVATDEFGIFGVHGAQATEKIASVFSEQTPDEHLQFVRGSMGEVGVTVVRTDAPTGEEGYEVVCGVADSEDVFDTLENRGLNAAPFGYRTWESLTLEAGTPLFPSELDGRLPNNLGLANAVDYEKGCFVGQEVVSRVENRGQPSRRLVGLAVEGEGEAESEAESETVSASVPDAGAAVFAGDGHVGEVTRALQSPILETPIVFALVEYDLDDSAALAVRIEGEERAASLVDLPFVDGSDSSARLPE